MKQVKSTQSKLRTNTFEGETDNDPRTPRERLIYPYTVERHLDGWAIFKSGKFAGPGCEFYDKDEKLIPLLDCLNRENAKAYA